MLDYKPKYEDFQKSFIAFIDILGFTERVEQITGREDFEEIANLLFAIRVIADKLTANKAILNTFQFTSVSDSLIASVPDTTPAGAMSILLLLHQIQYIILVNFKTLLRGYITRGQVYHKNGIFFGQGYIDAYKGERSVGLAPRIVLDLEIVRDATNNLDQQGREKLFMTIFDYLKEDQYDGLYFIDYLKPINVPSALPKETLIKNYQSITSFILESLKKYSIDGRKYPKYKWLENYCKDSKVLLD